MSSPDGAAKGAAASWSEARRPRLAFPRTARLTARGQFRETYARGRKASTKRLALFALPGTEGTSRLGITVTRKFGGAVLRNRIKRKLRDLFRRNLPSLVPPLDVVVNVRSEAATASPRELEEDFLGCFNQLARKLEP